MRPVIYSKDTCIAFFLGAYISKILLFVLSDMCSYGTIMRICLIANLPSDLREKIVATKSRFFFPFAIYCTKISDQKMTIMYKDEKKIGGR